MSQATDQTLELRNVIGGALRPAADGRTTAVIDPSTGEVYARAPLSGAEDVDAAYGAASEAFTTWGRTTPAERQLALLRLADAVEAHADEFVAVESRNTGKPLHLTATEEIPPCVDQLRFFAGAARMLDGRRAGEYMAGHTSWVRREPIGVVGAGHAVELPADDGDLEDRARARGRQHDRAQAVRHDAGVDRCCWPSSPPRCCPPGVLNVVCGDRDTGRALV